MLLAMIPQLLRLAKHVIQRQGLQVALNIIESAASVVRKLTVQVVAANSGGEVKSHLPTSNSEAFQMRIFFLSAAFLVLGSQAQQKQTTPVPKPSPQPHLEFLI